jgi:tRNA pseudouridine38-40 synthase
MSEQTLVMQVGYDGLGFNGFAAQPGLRTVAGSIETALNIVLRRPVELTCAGRTDTGVHARRQYVSLPVDSEELANPMRLYRSLEALLPEDISPRAIFSAAPGFSARFDARFRRYRYRICTGPRPVLMASRCWWLKTPLDVEAMDEAAQELVGERDFKSFCKASSAEGKPTCRFVRECRVTRGRELGEDVVNIDIAGNAFLHSMVRTVAGTLVDVGQGRREPSWVADVLAEKDRQAAGMCAPAQGLEFMDVEYNDGTLTLLYRPE